MLRESATSCWEDWGQRAEVILASATPGPVAVLIEDIAGFMPDPAAVEGYRFCPHIPREIGRFELALPFRGGGSIKKENGKTTLCKMTAKGS